MEMHELSEKYIQEVLVHLGISSSSLEEFRYNYMVSVSPGSFTLSFTPSAFVKAIPGIKPEGNRFVHFTSIRNLFSILQENSIRLYSLAGVNDLTEIQHTLKEIAPNYPYSRLDDIVYSMKERTFVFSLCQSEIIGSKNELNMWRLYGDDANGCCIEFEIEHGYSTERDFGLGNCIYQKLPLQRFLQANQEFENQTSRRLSNLSEVLKWPACYMKNQVFEIEQEIRLIKWEDYDFQYDVFNNKSNCGVDMNNRRDIVHFTKLPLEDFSGNSMRIFISKIILGPKVDTQMKDKIEKYIMHYWVKQRKLFEEKGIHQKDEFYNRIKNRFNTNIIPPVPVEISSFLGIYK
jgi:hypothetical protein